MAQIGVTAIGNEPFVLFANGCEVGRLGYNGAELAVELPEGEFLIVARADDRTPLKCGRP